MKNYRYREIHLLMNQELSIAIDSTFLKLATIASLEKVLKGKDKLSEEKRFSDSICELQSQLYDSYLPLVKSFTYQSKALTDFALQTHVLPLNLIEDLQLLLNYKEETNHITDGAFSPYVDNEDGFKDSILEYYLRLVSVLRIKAWLNDIENGLQEYGVDPYVLPETDSEGDINLLDGVYELSLEELKKELENYLLINEDFDSQEDIQDKTALISLNVVIDHLMEEKTNE